MTALSTARAPLRRRPVRCRLWSGRVSLRTASLIAAATAVVAALAVWATTLGDSPISAAGVLAATVGGGEGREVFIVRMLRLPRVLIAMGTGLALAVSGALFQGLLRNPLVAPDFVGVMSGATFAAVVAIVVFGSGGAAAPAALLGAIAATALLYGLTWRKGVTGHRLVLVGIGLHALFVALTTLVIVRYPVEWVSSAVLWTTGTLYGSDWTEVLGLAMALLVLLPAALALMPRLRVLQLGDDAAAALGTRAEASRAGLLVTAACLAAVAVAVAGPLAFVALMTPHMARMLAGPLTGGVLLLAGALGAALVLASDMIAQHAFSATSLPVGVVTAALGAPFFLFLLYRSNRVI